MRDDADGTVSVPLASAAAYYLRETVPGGAGEPLTLACWESGHDLEIEDGAELMPAARRRSADLRVGPAAAANPRNRRPDRLPRRGRLPGGRRGRAQRTRRTANAGIASGAIPFRIGIEGPG